MSRWRSPSNHRMSEGSTMMPELDHKAIDVFAGKVVRKDLVRRVKVGANVPIYVLEYLLGKYCATDDPAAVEAGLRVVNSTLADNFVRPDEATKAQSRVKERGDYTFIDKVRYGWTRRNIGLNSSTLVTATCRCPIILYT